MNNARLLLCTDMDRTIIPNGAQLEHPQARQRFHDFCKLPAVTLAFVTGRHLQLLEDAIAQYQLPRPDFAITDVGSKIYRYSNQRWQDFIEWEREIDQDWHGHDRSQIGELLADIDGLRLQEAQQQNTHKISYYLTLDIDHDLVMREIEKRLQPHQIQASLIWSIDEQKGIGLLDVLPRNATKLHAIRFLQQQLGYRLDEVVFAGDSGNDLPVLTSEVRSILVNNASDEIKNTVTEVAKQKGLSDTLYIASSSDIGMDGNYAAGVLQGIWHFAPDFRRQIQTPGQTIIK